MFARFSMARNPAVRFFAFLSMMWLAACDTAILSPTANTGQQIDAGAPVQVALLVPGGSGAGSDAFLAQNLENAARLAIADLNGPDIRLRVYNTGANPVLAADVARAAVADGAQIILGPLFGEAANAAGVAVASQNVNVLAFSNNPTIAGGNVFILGATFQNTADRLVRYAGRQGLNRFLVLHGDDAGGAIGRDAITSAVQNNGSQVVATQSYPLSQQGIISSTGRIAAAARNADAIFMTAGVNADLPILATTLPEAGVTSRFIGLTRWDAAPQAAALPGLQGGLFATADRARTSLFNDRYAATYGENPHPLAGLAYDGIAAIGALVASGESNALTKAALTNPQGFQGTSGVFRFLPNGLNERALAVATFQDNQVVILEQAPRSFGAGF
ncbi:penicillin-binding protein activator [Yoonia sediminilitoris]|uniref:Amino acid/amide ABC transporter substrate-binding protein (HAAT family) n=1 Tax=Yoonia sediminilitoris TaxID=1286148 RepID=A0A2T6KK57_9RHOB|nr:penicillin-binding protein activator [Yoonia sediminilitoris]PUB16350.1 amino acid/amide ABC transporter substrate-binding protein (HAAT family) [Yoonia sediminilitoris]RCW96699.1 amino acid/amide ABC transporter substrate-binding protein (HAAT family) [Yoonia sediminilitoris]